MSPLLAIVVFLSLALSTSSYPTESRHCRPGFFHNVTIDLCQVCPSGTYTDSYNLNSHCERCSTCTGLRVTVAACNASRDAVCRCPDGYYEHEDGCSPQTGAYAEARSSDTPEWTWIQYLLIITFVLVAVVIIFLIYIVARYPELRMKVFNCKRNRIPGNAQLTFEQQRADLDNLATEVRTMIDQCQEKLDSLNKASNQLNPPINSECSRQPPNGTPGGGATNTRDNTTQQQGEEGLAAASRSTVATHSKPALEIAAGCAVIAGAQGAAAEVAQAHVDSTPKKDGRSSRILEAVDSHEMVDLPPKTSSGGLATAYGNEGSPSGEVLSMQPNVLATISDGLKTISSNRAVSSQPCGMGNNHQNGCVKCNETTDLSSAGTMECAEELQKSSTEVDAASENATENDPLLIGTNRV